MIKSIRLKSSSSPERDNLEFNTTPITIFVGPNNSGKSKILIEIENYCRKKKPQSNQLVLDTISFLEFKEEIIKEEINKIKVDPDSTRNLNQGEILLSNINPLRNDKPFQFICNEETLINEAIDPNNYNFGYYREFLNMYTLRLDGTSRLNLLKEQKVTDLKKTPTNYLSKLFIDNNLRYKVREIIYNSFQKYYVIDPTKIGYLSVGFSDTLPNNESEERGWQEESVEFHKKTLKIDKASDGVKAFTGIITTVIAGDPKIILIDEPEAFLHPSLSNTLGNEIGKSLINSNKKLFVSTHSSNFLMGCIQSKSPLNIVRLTYKNNEATSRILDTDKILTLMKNPLLRSTGVLNGLFYEAVIVTESDSDRAFYQEINERLLEKNDKRGIQNCLFINAQNKQTVWDIVKPLRELGIPTVGIVDIDVIKEGGRVFSKLLKGAFIPELSQETLNKQRELIKKAFINSGKDMKKDGGIQLLDPDSKESCLNFFNSLSDYGVMIIKNGELESWLKSLKVGGHGSKWLIDIFKKMGENPNDKSYIKPENNDVWDFIGEIKFWIENNKRKGIPK